MIKHSLILNITQEIIDYNNKNKGLFKVLRTITFNQVDALHNQFMEYNDSLGIEGRIVFRPGNKPDKANNLRGTVLEIFEVSEDDFNRALNNLIDLVGKSRNEYFKNESTGVIRYYFKLQNTTLEIRDIQDEKIELLLEIKSMALEKKSYIDTETGQVVYRYRIFFN